MESLRGMQLGELHEHRERLSGERERKRAEWGEELLPLAGGEESDEERVEVEVFLEEKPQTLVESLREEERERDIEREGDRERVGEKERERETKKERPERDSEKVIERAREGERENPGKEREKRQSGGICCGHSDARRALGRFPVDSCTYLFENRERDEESERYIAAFKRHCSEQTRDSVALEANADHTLAVGFLSSTADPNSGIMGLDQEQRLLVQREQEAQERMVEHQQQFFYFPPEEEAYAVGYNLVVDLPSRPNPALTAVMGCCPCFIGDPCSTLKRLEYKKAIKTICFFISILQILMFIISLSLDGFAPVSDNWLLGPTGDALVSMGAKDAYLIKESLQVWRYVTPCFLHAGIIQLAFNLFAQLRMGLYLERTWGWYRFTVMYFVSGTAGMCLSSCLQPNSISVAASASLMGVMGGYLAQLNVTWQKLEGWQKKMHLSMCVTIIMTTFIIGVGPNYVDSTAHIGGLIVGMVMGYGAFGKEKARDNKRRRRLLQVVSWTVVLLFFAAAILVLFVIIPVTDPEATSGSGSGSGGYGNSTYPYGNYSSYWVANDTAIYDEELAGSQARLWAVERDMRGDGRGEQRLSSGSLWDGGVQALIESAAELVKLPFATQGGVQSTAAVQSEEPRVYGGIDSFASLLLRRREPSL